MSSLFSLFLALAICANAQNSRSAYDFYSHGPYRKNVPRPSAVLGYEAGETHSTFRDQERVLSAIANAAKDRVRLVDYGKSVEGRPLRLAIVSAPENLAKLDAIRTQIGKLADPRRLANDAEATKILQTTPTLTWINHCIHGDETASFESAMWALYTLAASENPDIESALHQSVIILNPVFNPDGHERFVVYYNSVAVGSPEPFALEKERSWVATGRFNHYRFDMNRDKLAQSQPETQQETAAYLHWNPQVYVDQHGQPEIYFFPPNSLPENTLVDRERTDRWTNVFGKANGAAFDKYGWQYVTRETFDLFYPGYLDSFSTLSGAIGMTYETDGGGNLARRREDQTISTLRDGTAHHFETALATILTAARNREGLLRDFLKFHRAAITSGQTDPMKRVVILPGRDKGRLEEFAALMRRVGVEVKETTAPLESAKAHAYLPPTVKAGEKPGPAAMTFPAGSLVIDLAQPQGRVARAFLEPDAPFEPDFVKSQLARRDQNLKRNDNERKEGYDFYDITAWSLPLTYGLDAYWTEEAPNVAGRLLEADADGTVRLQGHTGGVQGGRAQVAYLIPYRSDAAALLGLRLLQEDFRLGVVTKPIRVEGKEWGRGTLVARVVRNPETLHRRLEELSRTLGVDVFAVNTGYGDETSGGLGSEYIVNVKKPSIAVAADEGVSQTGFGAVWHLLEKQAGVKFTSIRLSRLRSADLSRFNVLILPDGFGYAGALGKGGIDALKEWVARGGALIGIGGGGEWYTDKDNGLTTATAVGSDDKTDGEAPAKPAGEKAAEKPDEKPKAKKPTDLPGAIFRAKLDTTHFLGYGYENGEIAVPLSGSTFLKPSKKGANVITFGKEGQRLAGFVWPDDTERFLANTVWLLDEPTGAGHVIYFLDDPTFRSYWIGLRRLVLNSILFAPGRVPSIPSGSELK